jgi:hypothetical protein
MNLPLATQVFVQETIAQPVHAFSFTQSRLFLLPLWQQHYYHPIPGIFLHFAHRVVGCQQSCIGQNLGTNDCSLDCIEKGGFGAVVEGSVWIR